MQLPKLHLAGTSSPETALPPLLFPSDCQFENHKWRMENPWLWPMSSKPGAIVVWHPHGVLRGSGLGFVGMVLAIVDPPSLICGRLKHQV